MYAIINTYKTYNLDYHVISYKGGIIMTEQLIKDIKNIQKRLINKEMTGEAYEEKMQIVKKLEEVNNYLKDALSDGIEF